MKDPQVTGIGQDTYKTAAECRSTYFSPLSEAGDSYDGKYVQVAEPPGKNSNATLRIEKPMASLENLDFLKDSQPSNDEIVTNTLLLQKGKFRKSKVGKIKKRTWQDLVDKNFLTDTQAVAAFEDCQMGRVIRVHRTDVEHGDYYLVPFQKVANNKNQLTSAVVILNVEDGSFKEVSWTTTPEKFLRVNKMEAVNLVRVAVIKNLLKELAALSHGKVRDYRVKRNNLVRNYLRTMSYLRSSKSTLLWEPHSRYSLNPYRPYWKIGFGMDAWYVTQEGKILSLGADPL